MRTFQPNTRIACFLPAFLLLAGMAWADVYRCVSEDGTVLFSDQPCAGNAELFIEEEACNIDASIRRAYPFKDLTLKSEEVNDRLLSHARKLGNCILPGKTYSAYHVKEHHFRNLQHDWSITVDYKDGKGKNIWSLIFCYHVKLDNAARRIRMEAVLVQFMRKAHDLPLLEKITSFNRLGTGRYVVELW